MSVLKVLSILAFFTSHWSCVAALPYDYGFDVRTMVKRQLIRPFVVSGMSRLDNVTLPRLEIRQLQGDADEWTLYILALSMMQYTDQTEQFSWYQIAGIHGVPFVPWGGVEATPGNEETGYCTHISTLFPTWHRPYLALYEQLLCGLERSIASYYQTDDLRQHYQGVAEKCRIPYFDWARAAPTGKRSLPLSIGGSPFIEIPGPNGVQNISNPLFTYEFKPLNSTVFLADPWDTWNTTLRAPTSNASFAQSNNSDVAAQLAANLPSLQQRLYNLFSNYDNYTTFSNEGWIPQTGDSDYDSLESLHDTVHTILGGGMGQMAFIPFSSFDPVFFLHHAMVDRIFALWQVLYPDAWITPQPAKMNSYTTSVGENQSSNTSLTPFYADSNGTFWDSDMVRDLTVFGYTYAELVTTETSNTTTRDQVVEAINELYGGSSPSTLPLRLQKVQSSKRWLDPRTSSLLTSARKVINDDNQTREWTANVRVDKQALGGSFFIHILLSGDTEDDQSWRSSPSLVGTMSVFASPPQYMRHMHAHNMIISGTVPLTAAITEKVTGGFIHDLDVHSVEPYLRETLQVRVVRADGTVVPPETVRHLSIRVVSARVQAPTGEHELPVWGQTDFAFDLI